MANELLIKINADAKNAEAAFDDIKDQTSELEGKLKSVALISGVAFAAFTATVYSSVKAFEEAQAASIELNNALQNQGIYTKELREEYDSFARAVQAKTGIDDDAISKAQAVAQTYLGQTKITEELTFAIANLGAKMGGDLNGAAEKIARTIGTGTNAFAKQGLVIAETATEQERMANVLDFVRAKSAGLAEEMNRADGFSKALGTSFGNLQEKIGEKFAPVVAAVRQSFIQFFDYLSGNPALVKVIAAFLTAGVVVAGLGTALAVAVPIFTTLTAAAAAFGVAANIALAGIPLLIAGVVAGITLVALNWEKVTAHVRALSTGLVTFMSEAFSGLGKVLSGAFSLDINKIKEGLSQVSGAYGKAKDETIATFQEITLAQVTETLKQDADKKNAADREAAERRAHQANLLAIDQAGLELMKLQNEFASQEQIDLKQKEIDNLKAIDQESSAAKLELLRERRAQILALEDEQQAEDSDRAIAFAAVQAEVLASLKGQDIALADELRASQIQKLRAAALTENDIERNLLADVTAKRIAARNADLLERKKYGETVATLTKILGSDEVKGAKRAADDLVALQQSKSKELRDIGKVAAVFQITVATAESAMNIYRGFSAIPIVGPALGIAGAAAAIAFGAERLGQVTSAASGGLIEGGIAGKDSVPAMLMPGELVVPRRNFNEVVGAIQGNDTGVGGPEVLDELKSMNNKLDNVGNYTFNGDMTTDESYVDRLVVKISEAIEFRNAKIFGVT